MEDSIWIYRKVLYSSVRDKGYLKRMKGSCDTAGRVDHISDLITNYKFATWGRGVVLGHFWQLSTPRL